MSILLQTNLAGLKIINNEKPQMYILYLMTTFPVELAANVEMKRIGFDVYKIFR